MARIAELDLEIRAAAGQHYASIAGHYNIKREFSGAARRVLSDRLLERLALEQMLACETEAQAVIDDQARAQGERAAVAASFHRAEEERRERDERWAAQAAAVSASLYRVKSTINRCAQPAQADVEVLRKNPTFTDQRTRCGEVEQLLWRIDTDPWWPQQSKGKEP